MTDHETSLLEVRDKPTGRPDGFVAGCSCGWASAEVRPTASAALVDLGAHTRTLAPRPKGKP